MENTKKGWPCSFLHALIPTEVKGNFLRDLGDNWEGSKPELLDQVLGRVGNNCRSWSSLEQVEIELKPKGEEPCWPPLPSKITDFSSTKITALFALKSLPFALVENGRKLFEVGYHHLPLEAKQAATGFTPCAGGRGEIFLGIPLERTFPFPVSSVP